MLTGFLLCGLFSYNNGDKQNKTARTEFLDKAGMDTAVRPQDNFYQYANGLWMKNTKILSDWSAG